MSGEAKRLTLPREHGAYLTLAGSAVAGVVLAPAHLPALAAACAVAAAFLARGPLERSAIGHRLRAWDPAALVVLAALLASGVVLVARERIAVAAITGSFAAVLIAGALLAKRSSALRHPAFEALGLGALGATAGVIASAGGIVPRDAICAALALGAHAALSVPVVRARLRPREPVVAARIVGVAAAGVAAAAVIAIGRPYVALALVPRLLQLALRPGGHATAKRVGLEETGILAAVVTVVILAIVAANPA